MSALNEEGVMAVRSAACDRLLASRVDLKLKVGSYSSSKDDVHCSTLRF